MQISNLINKFNNGSSFFSSKRFNSNIIKENIYLIRILFLPDDLYLNSIENLSKFLAFYVSNNEFNFEFDKIFLPLGNHFDSGDKYNYNSNMEYFRFCLLNKLVGLSSLNKINNVIFGNLEDKNSNNNNIGGIIGNEIEGLRKFMPSENKANWR